ncbi:MAG: winged helix DNA-binding protein [Chloroflexota bacterium]|nr:winged helix DNA-binding protein [Chloroflexota bacterium]
MDRGQELRYLVLALQREGNRQLMETLRPLKLTPAQAEVMQVLAQYQPMTLLQVGERLVCETGSPSRLVNSMVEAGWVKKSPNPADGRAVLLRLTAAAESMQPALNAIDAQFNEGVASAFSDEVLTALLDYLWSAAIDTPSGQALQRRKHNE